MAKMTVQRKKQGAEKHPIMHRIADIRGGVGVKTSEFKGDFIPEGAPVVLEAATGLYKALACGIAQAEVSRDSDVKVSKGSGFAVGDGLFFAGSSAQSGTITAIDTSHKDYDILKTQDDLGNVTKGAIVLSGDIANAIGLCGTNTPVEAGANAQIDVWVAAVTKGWISNGVLSNHAGLRGIINVD